MARRTAVCVGLLVLVVASVAMAGHALYRYPALWLQPGASSYVLQAVGALLLYLAAIVWAMGRRQPWWDVAFGVAAVFGSVSGGIEALNTASENGLLPTVHGAALPLSLMLGLFLVWGIAGWRGARVLGSVRGGAVTAVLSAVVCMVVAVSAGFLVELLLSPQPPSVVATWAEYRRSGWTDARAFEIANTLDSAWTHLLLGPLVALIFGGVGAWIGRPRFARSATPAREGVCGARASTAKNRRSDP